MHTTRNKYLSENKRRVPEKTEQRLQYLEFSRQRKASLNKLYNKLITCYVKSIWPLSVKAATTSGAEELCKHQQRSV